MAGPDEGEAMKDKIEKLPKWARKHIESLERDRDDATDLMRKMTDDQTPSPFYIEEFRGGAAGVQRRYFQAHQIAVEHLGIVMHVILRENCIDISYGLESCAIGDVAMVPQSRQAVALIPFSQRFPRSRD